MTLSVFAATRERGTAAQRSPGRAAWPTGTERLPGKVAATNTARAGSDDQCRDGKQ